MRRSEPARAASNPALEAAILAAPGSQGPYIAYGAWLRAQGDPRGELIAVQAALLEAPSDAALVARERALLEEHERAFLGDLLDVDGADDDVALEWHLGFLRSVAIGAGEYSDVDAEGVCRALFALPSAKFLHTLRFRAFGTEDGEPDYAGVLKTLAKQALPRSLRSLSFSIEGFPISSSDLGDLAPLYPSLPNLEELRIKMGRMKLGKIVLPRLELFEVITGGLTRDNARSLAGATWPALSTLIVYFGAEEYGASATVADVQPILDAKGLPALRHLALANSELADDLAAAAPRSRVVKQLESLDLSKGTMRDAGLEALVGGARALRHLARLDVSENYLSASACERLESALPGVQVVTASQGDPDEDYRFVQVSE